MKIKLSIIIVTYMSDEYIDLCIDSIYQYNDIGNENIKIIVVDNSPPYYPMYNRVSKKYKDVVFIQNKSNVGFGTANNIGASVIESEYILFFNPDAELIEPVFKNIISRFENDGKLGCLGIKQSGGGLSFFL